MTRKQNERREFLRFDYEKPLHFSLVSSPRDRGILSSFINAVSKNISASGILFRVEDGAIPEIASLVMLDLDYKTSNICREIDERALIKNNKLLGKVVRIEENSDGTRGVGVAFVTKSDRLSKDIKDKIEKK